MGTDAGRWIDTVCEVLYKLSSSCFCFHCEIEGKSLSESEYRGGSGGGLRKEKVWRGLQKSERECIEQRNVVWHLGSHKWGPSAWLFFSCWWVLTTFPRNFWYNQEWEGEEWWGKNGDNSLRGPYDQKRIPFFPRWKRLQHMCILMGMIWEEGKNWGRRG